MKYLGLTKNNFNFYILIIVARFFDILTTYAAGNGDLSGEMNILIRVFHLGWTSLFLSEIIILAIVYILMRLQTDSFYMKEEKKIIKENLPFNEYLGILYFGRKISLIKALFSKINYKLAINSFIDLFLITVTIASFLIGINNILSSLNYFNLYNFSNIIFQKNIPNILNLIVFICAVVFYHYYRYKKYMTSKT